MLGSVKNELPIELVNAVLLALFAVLPVLIVGFTWQSLLALRIRPVFSLLRFESDEMDRATILHQDVCRRLKQQRDMCERAAGLSGALFDRHKHSYEIEGLEAHAQYLRTTIMRLRHQPLLRIKTWLHIKSAQFAFSGALVTYVTIAFLVVAFFILKRSASAGDYMSGASDAFVCTLSMPMPSPQDLPPWRRRSAILCGGSLCADSTVWNFACLRNLQKLSPVNFSINLTLKTLPKIRRRQKIQAQILTSTTGIQFLVFQRLLQSKRSGRLIRR
jgi:hypothetical protein